MHCGLPGVSLEAKCCIQITEVAGLKAAAATCQAECRPAGVKIANVVVLHDILVALVVFVALSLRRVAVFYRLLAGSSAWLQHMRLIKAAGAFGIRDALPNQNKPC